MDKKEVPTGVKVISVLYCIGILIAIYSTIHIITERPARQPTFPDIFIGILTALFGMMLLPYTISGAVGYLIGSYSVVSKLIYFFISTVPILFIARGLWKGQKWSRLVVIILTVTYLGYGGYIVVALAKTHNLLFT